MQHARMIIDQVSESVSKPQIKCLELLCSWFLCTEIEQWLRHSFCFLFLGGSLSTKGKDLMEISLVGLNVPRPLTLHNVWLQVSLYSHLLQEKVSLMIAEQGTYYHIAVLFGSFYCYGYMVLLLLLLLLLLFWCYFFVFCLFFQSTSIGLPSRFLDYAVSGSWSTKQCQLFHLVDWIFSQIKLIPHTKLLPPL